MSSLLLSASVSVVPRSFSEKTRLSARHSSALRGMRPAVSTGTSTDPVRLIRWQSFCLPLCSTKASAKYAPSAADTPSSAARASRSASVKPSEESRRKSWKCCARR